MILRGLVLHQPWAWAILNGKTVENRPQNFKHRGPLIIVASKLKNFDYYFQAQGFIARIHGAQPPALPNLNNGGIIGAVEVFDCKPPSAFPVNEWHMRANDKGRPQFAICIRNPVTLPFRAFRGHQGLMNVEVTPDEVSTLRKGGLLP